MMNISALKEWRGILFLLPLLEGDDEQEFRLYTMSLKERNPDLVIDYLYWNGNKSRAKDKNYVRGASEWNHTDFSMLGKMRNSHIKQFFENEYEAFVVFIKDLPEKVKKVLKNSPSRLKIGFAEDFEAFDVVLLKDSANLQDQLNVLQKYLTK